MNEDRSRLRRLTGALPVWTRLWAADSAVLVFSQALTVLSSSFVAIVLARYLEPELWGLFAGLLGLALGLAIVIDFGLGTWLLRELSRPARTEPDEAGRLLGATIGINVVIGGCVLVAALAVTSIAGSSGETRLTLALLVVYGLLIASATALEALLRSRRQVFRVFLCSFYEKALLVALTIALVLSEASLASLGLAYASAGLVRVGVAAYYVLHREGLRLVAATPREARRYAKRGLPFILAIAAMNVIPRIDVLLLLTLSSTSAAYFALGERLLLPALVASAAFSITLYPFLSGGAALGVGLRLSVTVGALGALVCVVGVLLTPWLVPLLFGEDYRDAVPVVTIMLLVIPFVYATGPLLTHLYSLGREREVLVATLGMSLLGSAAIVLGELVGGPTMAAAGAVLRQALFLTSLVAVAVLVDRSRQPERALTLTQEQS